MNSLSVQSYFGADKDQKYGSSYVSEKPKRKPSQIACVELCEVSQSKSVILVKVRRVASTVQTRSVIVVVYLPHQNAESSSLNFSMLIFR